MVLQEMMENQSVSNKSFGEQLRERVFAEFGKTKGAALASAYEGAKSKLERDVYDEIRGTEPNLSDHGKRHIENVERNVIDLLTKDGNDGVITGLSGIEIYCLGMIVLFHDAGNIFGRSRHHNMVARVFDQVRGKERVVRRERTLVVKAARAHTGLSQDGSHDTLKELSEVEHLEGKPVRLRELAALARFADELAEGPQRTSEFMLENDLYEAGSTIFHEYAASTHILIDRPNGRIVVAYEIIIDRDQADSCRERKLCNFLDFVYTRIVKLNQERQYNRYYSQLLQPFRFTEITMNFHCGEDILETNLVPLRLTDIVVPGEDAKRIPDVDSSYQLDRLVPDLLSRCPQEVPQ